MLTPLSRLFKTKSPRSHRTRSSLHAPTPLEQRLLLTVDLQYAGGSFNAFASTTVANEYQMDLTIDVRNAGTTTASLTGQLNDFSDNVLVRAVFSTDTTYGNGDDIEIGSARFSGPLLDNQNITLDPNQSRTIDLVSTITANTSYQFILIKVDSGDTVAESQENNNTNTPLVLSTGFSVLNLYTPDSFPAGATVKMAPATSSIRALNQTNYANSLFQIKIDDADIVPGDRFGLAKSTFNDLSLKRAGKNLKLGSETVGTIEGGKKGLPFKIQFGNSADTLLINQVFQNITFKSKKNQPGLRDSHATLTLANNAVLTNGTDTLNVT